MKKKNEKEISVLKYLIKYFLSDYKYYLIDNNILF